MIKQDIHVFKGMSKDLSKSKFSNEFLFDAYNIRITSREKETLLSVTNEKGNKEIPIHHWVDNSITSLPGTVLGYCVINDKLIVFTTGDSFYKDCIFRLTINKGAELSFTSKLIANGDMNFSLDYPIETLGVYENEDIQKVYWVDGLNLPRVINVTRTHVYNLFDFKLSIKEVPIVSISKSISGGTFPAGTIQYAFNYYKLYGQESPIIYSSETFYLASGNLGSSPETTVNSSFNITIYNPDKTFDYIRLYSIIRTSIDSTPLVKRIVDLKIDTLSNIIKYTDSGTVGSTIDPTQLLYIGGDVITAETLCLKDNTLFLGNIKVKQNDLSSIKDEVKRLDIRTSLDFIPNYKLDYTGTYPWTSQLNNSSREIKFFKSREYYRLGFRGIDKYGKKSEVIWIKDHYNTSKPFHYLGQILKPYLLCPLTKSIIDKLKSLGYVSLEPMIVYPTDADRECICLGLICPTVYNTLDRMTNSPFVLSSWFTRPYPTTNLTLSNLVPPSDEYNNDKHIDKGVWYEYIHNACLPESNYRNAEIQCNYKAFFDLDSYKGAYQVPTNINDTNFSKFIKDTKNDYHVDSNVVTFHSPEIEFESIYNIDSYNLDFRIVAVAALSGTTTKVNLTTSTPPIDSKSIGFTDPNIVNTNFDSFSFRSLGTYPMWVDRIAGNNSTFTGFMVYPWQRTGSLTNYDSLTNGDTVKPAMLKHKRMSVLRFFNRNIYLDNPWTPSLGITPVSIFNSNEVTNIKIPSPENSKLSNLNYYGNCDKVLTTPTINGYPIMSTKTVSSTTGFDLSDLLLSTIQEVPSTITTITKSSDPVSIRYKSGPHAVFAFNFVKRNLPVVLPFLKGYELSAGGGILDYAPFWDKDGGIFTPHCDTINDPSLSLVLILDSAYMYIGEFYRSTVENRFGGTSESAIENNLWVAAGPIINLNDDSIVNTVLKFTEGDTFYLRYDALKTYAFSNDDYNSIVDIPSFMCETRINLDGRYDKNRGNIDNTYINRTNFNLLNKVYSQKNNFFTGRALNYNKINSKKYNNAIIWSKPKILGEDVDTWTSLSLASTLELDGTKEEITSLNTFNNEIICFQKQSISQILFNSRVQVPTSDGVPIEISNNYKVDGKRYLSNTVGCNNKFSICETNNGLYFIDNATSSIYLFNGQLLSISDKLGFRLWLGKYTNMDKWTPNNDNFKTFYDKNNDDIYFVTKDTCLCYSLLLQLFTSFMSYEDTPAMFNIDSNFVAIKNNKVWNQFQGDYNMFYGQYKPYSITLISNPEEPYDKIFDNIEFRADMWDSLGNLLNSTFDTLEVWNEYLFGKASLINTKDKPSLLKKKFRIWRASIPRANTNWNGVIANGRDRIRNTWAYLKLSNNTINTNMLELHDVLVHYTV